MLSYRDIHMTVTSSSGGSQSSCRHTTARLFSACFLLVGASHRVRAADPLDPGLTPLEPSLPMTLKQQLQEAEWDALEQREDMALVAAGRGPSGEGMYGSCAIGTLNTGSRCAAARDIP